MREDEKYDLGAEKQQEAAQRMRELSARSKYKESARAPDNNCCKAKRQPEKAVNNNGTTDFLPGISIPFLGEFGIDSDIALILGLVLILTAEKSDKLLLLALLYILI